MYGIIKQHNERSGSNYHEAVYRYNFVKGFLLYSYNFSEEYYSSCRTSFRWQFGMNFEKRYSQIVARCFIRMKRTDDLLIPIKVRISLTLSDVIAPVLSTFQFPEVAVVGGQELKILGPVLDSLTMIYIAEQPLDVTLCFRFVDCHNNKRELDVSPDYNGNCARPAKQSKI